MVRPPVALQIKKKKISLRQPDTSHLHAMMKAAAAAAAACSGVRQLEAEGRGGSAAGAYIH